MEQPFWQFIAKLGWAVLFNFIFILTCIPIITIGASITALDTVMMKIAKGEGSHYVRMYFQSFLASFVSSTISWVLTVIVSIFFFVDAVLMYHESMKILFVLALLACFAVLMFIQTVFALTARFEGSWHETISRARFVWMQDFWLVAVAAILNIIIIGGVGWSIRVRNVFSWLVILWFGLAALCNAFVYNRIFHKYSEDEIEEEIVLEEIPEDPFAKLRGEYKE